MKLAKDRGFLEEIEIYQAENSRIIEVFTRWQYCCVKRNKDNMMITNSW